LRDGSTVKETSVRLGYEDPSHFSREFKNYYGSAPNKHPNWRVKTAATLKMSHSAMKLSRLAMKS
jgi:AraC-like DNA-binding protein